MLAQVDALRAVGAESVLVVTPFPQASNEERRRYLEDRGFEVAAIGGVERSGPSSIGGFPSGIIHRLARTLAAEVDGGFDAINVANPQWEAANYIEAIEGDLGCPVVTSSQAQVWKAFELGGIAPQVDGYGVLFDHL